MDKIIIIKVGGAILENEQSLCCLLDDFATLSGRKVLVHGGGRAATRIASALGIESQMINGRRVTDEKMLDVVTMVYGGLINKQTVAGLQARGVNAIGLTGADMNVVCGHKRQTKDIDYGWVGDVDRTNGAQLRLLIEQNMVPVIAPLIHDGKGQLLNTNADTIASQVACALAEFYDVTLTFCFEKPGVLSNPDDNSSVISHITTSTFSTMVKKGTITAGMLPKLENAFEAIKKGVSRVVITRSDDLSGSRGTLISK